MIRPHPPREKSRVRVVMAFTRVRWVVGWGEVISCQGLRWKIEWKNQSLGEMPLHILSKATCNSLVGDWSPSKESSPSFNFSRFFNSDIWVKILMIVSTEIKTLDFSGGSMKISTYFSHRPYRILTKVWALHIYSDVSLFIFFIVLYICTNYISFL